VLAAGDRSASTTTSAMFADDRPSDSRHDSSFDNLSVPFLLPTDLLPVPDVADNHDLRHGDAVAARDASSADDDKRWMFLAGSIVLRPIHTARPTDRHDSTRRSSCIDRVGVGRCELAVRVSRPTRHRVVRRIDDDYPPGQSLGYSVTDVDGCFWRWWRCRCGFCSGTFSCCCPYSASDI